MVIASNVACYNKRVSDTKKAGQWQSVEFTDQAKDGTVDSGGGYTGGSIVEWRASTVAWRAWMPPWTSSFEQTRGRSSNARRRSPAD